MMLRYAVNVIEIAGLLALALELWRRWGAIPGVVALQYGFSGRPRWYGPKAFLAVPVATMLFAYGITEWALAQPDARIPQAGPAAVEAFVAILIWGMYVMQRAVLDVADGRRSTLDTARTAVPIALIFCAIGALVALP